MKLKLLLPALLILHLQLAYSQAPEIQWQNTIGGTGDDEAYSIQMTHDGGFIVGGHSNSNASGDKSEPCYGGFWGDYWVLKLNNTGEIEWQNTIAGDNDDYLVMVIQTLDYGYFLAGWSDSDSMFDKIENNIGESDYWVVKTDSLGNIEWQNSIGGSIADFLYCAKQTNDGGFILGGESSSGISGDKTEPSNGGHDYWVIKLDSIGNIEWQKTIGGCSSDWLRSIQQTSDGGYILGGTSNSDACGDKIENSQGYVDYWVVKIDSIGNIEWQNTIGGSQDDYLYLPYSTIQTNDLGYLVGGYSYSGISGDKSEENMGIRDFWIVKLDTEGNIEWQNTIGGSSEDILASVDQTSDGNFILGGYSKSEVSGDKTEDNWGGGGLAGYDYWIVKVDSFGNIVWDKTIGGTNYEGLGLINETTDNEFVLIGTSRSDLSGNKTEDSQGGYDYWVIKLGSECLPIQEICNGIDDDCDGDIDNGLTFNIYFIDADYDDFGDPLIDTLWCMDIPGYVADSTDCDDTNSDIYPGAPELLNGYDDNCNNLIDEGLAIEDFADQQFIIYPVPASQALTIEFKNLSGGEIAIYDLTGRIVIKQSVLKSEREIIDVTNLTTGNYLLRFINDAGDAGAKMFVKAEIE